MSQSTLSAEIVEPYAEALMSVAQANNVTDQISQDVALTLDMLQTSPEFEAFLLNPFIKAEAKKAVLRQLTESKVQHTFLNFLMLLVDRRRIVFLDPICKQYQALLRELNNTVLAEVTSTVDLTEPQKQRIIAKVQHMTHANQVELETSIDPELIGGVIIKVGSQVLDASIRGQLRRVSTSLMSATA